MHARAGAARAVHAGGALRAVQHRRVPDAARRGDPAAQPSGHVRRQVRSPQLSRLINLHLPRSKMLLGRVRIVSYDWLDGPATPEVPAPARMVGSAANAD